MAGAYTALTLEGGVGARKQPIFVPPTHPSRAGDKRSVSIVFFQMLQPRWEMNYCSRNIMLCLLTAEFERRRRRGRVGEVHLRHDKDPVDLG